MLIQDLRVIDIKGNLREVNSSSRGSIRARKATWKFDGVNQEFIVSSEGQLFVLFLSPTEEELICFLKGYSEYSPPCNVIVLNGDGSVRFKICPPKLISDAFNEYETKVGTKEALSELRFIQPEIIKQQSTEIFTLWIGFGFDWYEVRELNLKTGEFGKCIRAARL